MIFFLPSVKLPLENRGIVQRTLLRFCRKFSATISTGLLFVKAAESWCYSNSTLSFSDLCSYLFSFGYPAYRIYMCFFLPDLFSAFETCFRFPASVEVPRRFLRPPFIGIPVLPRQALLPLTFSAYVVVYEAFLIALVFFSVCPCRRKTLFLPVCASVFTSLPSSVPRRGPLALHSRQPRVPTL